MLNSAQLAAIEGKKKEKRFYKTFASSYRRFVLPFMDPSKDTGCD